MRTKGQILIVVAIVTSVALLLLAVAVDAGRLYVETARLKRSAQASADAGISKVAEQIVELASARITESDGDRLIEAWLTDDDRQMLIDDPMRAEAIAVAEEYASANGLDETDPRILELKINYPQEGYDPGDESQLMLEMRVLVRSSTTILMAGLLGQDFVELSAEALSAVPQR